MSSVLVEKIVNELHKDMRKVDEWIEGTYRYSVDLSEATRRKHVEMVEEVVNTVIDRRMDEIEGGILKCSSLENQKELYIRIDELNQLKGDGE